MTVPSLRYFQICYCGCKIKQLFFTLCDLDLDLVCVVLINFQSLVLLILSLLMYARSYELQ